MMGAREEAAKVLAGHASAAYHPDYDGMGASGIWCDMCGEGQDSPDVCEDEWLAAHQAAMLAPLFAAAQAEAFEQGQKSGARHADRMIAAHSIGRLDLPGPMSPNPYRTT